MSAPLREPTLVKEFRDLHAYVFELGRHVTLVYKRLESIEMQLKEISAKFEESTTVNKKEIVDIREKMFTNTEFDEFVGALQSKVEETLPSLPESQSITFESSEVTSRQTAVSLPQPGSSREEQQREIFSGHRSDTSKDSF